MRPLRISLAALAATAFGLTVAPAAPASAAACHSSIQVVCDTVGLVCHVVEQTPLAKLVACELA
jgi:hypothetical protein